MAPTRELAKQTADVFSDISELDVLSVYGGAPIDRQINALRKGVDVIVGTPGRIIDLIERKNLDLTRLQHVCLDEVDRMLDMGFADNVDDILKHAYKNSKWKSCDFSQCAIKLRNFNATCKYDLKDREYHYWNESVKLVTCF